MDESGAPPDTPISQPDGTSGPWTVARTPDTGRTGRTRTWIVVVLVAVAVAIGAVTAVLLIADSAAIHDGPGTATFTWTPIRSDLSNSTGNPPPQMFSADIEGHSVTGTSTLVIPTGGGALGGVLSGKPPTGPVPLFRYQGEFAGTPFDLTVLYSFPSSLSLSDPASFNAVQMTVTGTYGTSPVHATVTDATPTGPTSSRNVHFSGTIGHWKVAGTIFPTTGTSTRQAATANFVVSG